MSILTEIDPRTWLYRAIGVAAILALGTWAVHSYNTKVSIKAVGIALAKERAEVTPKMQALGVALQTAKATIEAMNLAAQTEQTKQLKEANDKTIQYQIVVKKNRELFAKLNAAMLGKSELDERLRNITEQSGGAQACTGDGGFCRRLGAAYAQCERDLSEAIETASRTNERAAKAEAGLRALQN